LPEGTIRELLGPGKGGAGVLSAKAPAVGDVVGEGLKGDVVPLWVVKYTAVVKNRGVVENKGYYAAAYLQD
jgi:glutamate--cysteine ligase regulatory subunit